jgi:MoxR-like ATPase
MRIHLGYPDAQAERALLQGENRRDLLAQLGPALQEGELATVQYEVQQVHVAPALLDYVQAIIDHTRKSPEYANGLSPRAALGLLHAARAWALIAGRTHVIPEDVQAVVPGVVAHRLSPGPEASRLNGSDVAEHLLKEVAVP